MFKPRVLFTHNRLDPTILYLYRVYHVTCIENQYKVWKKKTNVGKMLYASDVIMQMWRTRVKQEIRERDPEEIREIPTAILIRLFVASYTYCTVYNTYMFHKW